MERRSPRSSSLDFAVPPARLCVRDIHYPSNGYRVSPPTVYVPRKRVINEFVFFSDRPRRPSLLRASARAPGDELASEESSQPWWAKVARWSALVDGAIFAPTGESTAVRENAVVGVKRLLLPPPPLSPAIIRRGAVAKWLRFRAR